MRVQITARHCEIPDAVRSRAESQMERLTKFESRLSAAEVVFDEEKHTRKAEGILTVHGGPPVVARAEDSDFRSALDKMVDRLSKQLRRSHERLVDHQAPPPEIVEPAAVEE